jgi:hypothetical protein
MEPRIQMHRNPNLGAEKDRDPNEVINGYAYSYLKLCRGQGYAFASKIEPQPGDWILGEKVPEDMRLAGDPPGELGDGEVVVPSLTRLVHLRHIAVRDVRVRAVQRDPPPDVRRRHVRTKNTTGDHVPRVVLSLVVSHGSWSPQQSQRFPRSSNT